MRKTLVTAFGLGNLPIAPGTWGSAGAVVVFVAVWVAARSVAGPFPWLVASALVVLTGLASAGCVLLGPWTVRHYEKPDPSPCVIDELAGQWLALLALPVGGWQSLLAVCGCQFLLFRVFDIVKPPPARQMERFPAGWGILLDDLAAGLYANIVGQIVFRLLWLPQ